METHTINAENNEEDAETNIEKVKNKLRKQINELKSIITEITWNLNIYSFKDVKVVTKPNDPDDIINEYAHKPINIQTKLESQLYRYAGFYCTKCLENEYVFRFSPSNRYDKKNTFGIQFFIKDGKSTLGKWVMPMSIDLDDLKTEFSIDEPKNLPYFLRMCKNYIDCYFIRCEQYNTLMDTVSNIKNCTLQTSFGYTDIILELMGVYWVEDESYIDIIIYLTYAIDETRPYKIEVESKIGKELNKSLKRQLQSSLQVFQLLDLQAAFDCMFDEEPFTWSKENNDDSILQTNTLSSEEEEGFLETFLSSEKTSSIRQKRKRKINRVMKKRSKKKTSDILKIFEHDAESTSPQNKNKGAKKQSSVYKKRTETTKFTLTENTVKQKTLKQTKLMLEKNNLKLQQVNNIPSTVDSKRKLVAKLYGPSTSTPYRKNQESPHLSSATDIDNISGITVIEKNPLDARTKHNQTENAPAKVINSKATKNVKPLGEKKSIQLKKKTSHKKMRKT